MSRFERVINALLWVTAVYFLLLFAFGDDCKPGIWAVLTLLALKGSRS